MLITEDTLGDVQAHLRDAALPMIIWPKIEIFLGLAAAAIGLAVGGSYLWHASQNGLMLLLGFVLFVFGCYLALAGHRSHLYIFQARTTALLLQEIRRQRTS